MAIRAPDRNDDIVHGLSLPNVSGPIEPQRADRVQCDLT